MAVKQRSTKGVSQRKAAQASRATRVHRENKHYSFMLPMLMEQLGEPDVKLAYLAEPRGFTVSNTSKKRSKQSLRGNAWAQGLRTLLKHEYGVEYLDASYDEPVIFYTQAWYGGGVHCDPENTHKLAKDALFYLTPKGNGKDKFTGGMYEGPLYDSVEPRTIVYAWRLVTKKVEPIEVTDEKVEAPTEKSAFGLEDL